MNVHFIRKMIRLGREIPMSIFISTPTCAPKKFWTFDCKRAGETRNKKGKKTLKTLKSQYPFIFGFQGEFQILMHIHFHILKAKVPTSIFLWFLYGFSNLNGN